MVLGSQCSYGCCSSAGGCTGASVGRREWSQGQGSSGPCTAQPRGPQRGRHQGPSRMNPAPASTPTPGGWNEAGCGKKQAGQRFPGLRAQGARDTEHLELGRVGGPTSGHRGVGALLVGPRLQRLLGQLLQVPAGGGAEALQRQRHVLLSDEEGPHHTLGCVQQVCEWHLQTRTCDHCPWSQTQARLTLTCSLKP